MDYPLSHEISNHFLNCIVHNLSKVKGVEFEHSPSQSCELGIVDCEFCRPGTNLRNPPQVPTDPK